ncbi:MAG: flagellar filament capping protein FliD [Anaeromyxobacter sp.]|nr:flagellar filament capping protein FliD [Anaeromyxobacter sp.]MBL0276155.1 flagellar filament capping protein FliD [Anaeromyxobacter sp.]
MASNFTASGLASGIDTASIVDQLVSLESRPITQLQKRQTGVQAQISALAELVTKLSTLEAAAKDLGATGVLAAKVTSTNTAFSTAVGAGALSGRYAVRVDELAQASKWRSAAFATPTTGVQGGTLRLTVQGTTYPDLTIADGASLADVAFAIRQSGAPVSATVLTGMDPTTQLPASYLAITARDTGFAGADPTAALRVEFLTPAGAGQPLGFAETQAARNARFNVDGLDFSRQSNVVADAIGGLTLTLTKGGPGLPATGTVEDLVVSTDATGTQAKLQKFVDAYNSVMTLVQKQLNVNKDTNRGTTLAGESSVRSLQGLLHGLITTRVAGLPGVSTLADVGVKTARDGSLSIDATVLNAALGRDPAAIDALFSTATSGLSAVVSSMVQGQVKSGTGVLVSRQKGLSDTIKTMDTQIASLQRRVDAFRLALVKQFTAMEKTVSNLKASGNFLTAQLSANSSA